MKFGYGWNDDGERDTSHQKPTRKRRGGIQTKQRNKQPRNGGHFNHPYARQLGDFRAIRPRARGVHRESRPREDAPQRKLPHERARIRRNRLPNRLTRAGNVFNEHAREHLERQRGRRRYVRAQSPEKGAQKKTVRERERDALWFARGAQRGRRARRQCER